MSIIPLGGVQARYIKLVGKGNNQNAWNTYTEVRFYESAAQQNEDISYWPAYFGASGLAGQVGTSAQITLVGVDSSKAEFALKPSATVTYSVANPSIASISADGTITFLSAGTTAVTITATQDGFTAQITVNVISE